MTWARGELEHGKLERRKLVWPESGPLAQHWCNHDSSKGVTRVVSRRTVDDIVLVPGSS